MKNLLLIICSVVFFPMDSFKIEQKAIQPLLNEESPMQQKDNSPDMQKAQDYVAQSEYFIRYQQTTQALQSPNRAHNMRFTYKPNGFDVKPRVDSAAKWNIAFILEGLYRNDNLVMAAKNNAEPVTKDNRLEYAQNGYEIEYINGQDGMRQNFIVKQKPNGIGELKIKMQVVTINLTLLCSSNGLAGIQGGITQYYYKDLKVWDANQQLLKATMQLEGSELALIVNDKNATYPITIDPISTAAAAIVESNQASARMGYSAAGAGDVNKDGFSDVIVGAPYYDNGQTDEGAAFVYHGGPTGISTNAASMVESNQLNANLGFSVASAGDVNKDGYSDVIVGAVNYHNGQESEGAAFVYYGSASGISTTSAAIVESNQVSGWMGWSVASAGDVNKDGYSDVIVGVPRYYNGQTNEGAAFLYLGSASGISTTTAAVVESNQSDAYMGRSLASAGDVNGDGYSDVIVGVPFYDNGQPDEGAFFVYYGSTSGISTTASAMVESNQAGALMGISVASAGDVNKDGFSDVIVGALYYDNGDTDEGAAFVYHGSVSGISTTAAAMVEINQANAWVGWSVASVGDVNGDGYSDVIVGAPYYDNGQNNEGAAFVYHGSSTGISNTASAMVECNQVNAYMGYSVAGAGDVNGDGYSDVIVGAWLYDNGQTDEGAAFVYHGSSDGILPLRLLSFDAITAGKAVELFWQTSNEAQLSHFEIERSRYAANFEKVTSVKADNLSTGSHYQATDNQPFSGTSFYRLKSVDINGSFYYSKIVRILQGQLDVGVNVFPNPACTEFTVTLDAFEPGKKVEIVLLRADGKVQQSQSLTPVVKGQQVRIYVGYLHSGNYILQVRQGALQQSKKIMIVR